jgi:hypothetical protein
LIYGCFYRISFILKVQFINIKNIGPKISILIMNKFGIIIMILEIFKIYLFIFLMKKRERKMDETLTGRPNSALGLAPPRIQT